MDKKSFDCIIPEKTLLLYPTTDAIDILDIDTGTYDRLIVIDGTWSQAKAVAKQFIEHYPNVRPIRIALHKTLFWRYQSLSEHYLSTIEAVYYFLKAYQQKRGENEHAFDDLLYYFKYQYELVQNTYKDNPHKKFTSRKLCSKEYIQYEKVNEEK
jgi:DTW domain-containing protein YfiP